MVPVVTFNESIDVHEAAKYDRKIKVREKPVFLRKIYQFVTKFIFDEIFVDEINILTKYI